MSIHQQEQQEGELPGLGKMRELTRKFKELVNFLLVVENNSLSDPTYQGDFNPSEIENAFLSIELMEIELRQYAERYEAALKITRGIEDLQKSYEEEIASLREDLRKTQGIIKNQARESQRLREGLTKEREKGSRISNNALYNLDLQNSFHSIEVKILQARSIQSALITLFENFNRAFPEVECQIVFLAQENGEDITNQIAGSIKSSYELSRQQGTDSLLHTIVEENILFGFNSTSTSGLKQSRGNKTKLRSLGNKEVQYILKNVGVRKKAGFLNQEELQVIKGIFHNKNMQSGFVFPLSGLGIILVAHPEVDHYDSVQKTEHLRNFLENVSHTLGLISDIERNSKDSLTQMHRKGNEYELFQNWFHAIQEKGRDPYAETTIAFIDFDNFKSVNDREGGHGTGNLVIQTITKIIRESIRNTNLSIRWGGDEILLILDTPESTSKDILQRVIRKIQETVFVYHPRGSGIREGYTAKKKTQKNLGKNDFQVSISIGTAPLENTKSGNLNDDLNDAIFRADLVVNTQKQRGIKGGIYSQNDLPKN